MTGHPRPWLQFGRANLLPSERGRHGPGALRLLAVHPGGEDNAAQGREAAGGGGRGGMRWVGGYGVGSQVGLGGWGGDGEEGEK